MAVANRLLVIDDEPGITRVIEAVARGLGFEVMTVNDTNQFERAVDAIKPTIIMLDVAMPDRDGLELIGHLAAGKYLGKIVVMSGSDPRYIQMASRIAQVRGLDIAGTIEKPFRAQEVKSLLEGLIAD